MRLIDAEALAKFIDYGHLNNQNEKLYSENDIREMIDMMPTIDAEPVIRCKDCEYAKLIDKEDGWYECWHDKRVMHSDGYCSWAERMDTDEKI